MDWVRRPLTGREGTRDRDRICGMEKTNFFFFWSHMSYMLGTITMYVGALEEHQVSRARCEMVLRVPKENTCRMI